MYQFFNKNFRKKERFWLKWNVNWIVYPLLNMLLFFFPRIFGFVAKKQSGGNDNTCHLFAELDPGQPASAIVNFVTKVMIGQGKKDWRELTFHWFMIFSP